MPIRYDLIDIQTKAVVGSYKTRGTASRAADRRDLAYGAVRHVVRPVWAD